MTDIQQDIINALRTQIQAMEDVYEQILYASRRDEETTVLDFALAYDSQDGVSDYRREMSLIKDLKYNLESKWGN